VKRLYSNISRFFALDGKLLAPLRRENPISKVVLK